MGDGTVRQVPLVFNDFYSDEYTSEILPHGNICSAIVDEIHCLMENVLTVVPASEAQNDVDSKLVSGRWVNCNKQDLQNPKCRGAMLRKKLVRHR